MTEHNTIGIITAEKYNLETDIPPFLTVFRLNETEKPPAAISQREVFDTL